jgi:hypothetical protein
MSKYTSKLSIYVLSLVSLQVRMQNKEEQQRIVGSKCVEEHCLTDSEFFLGFSFPQDKTTGIPQEGEKKTLHFFIHLTFARGKVRKGRDLHVGEGSVKETTNALWHPSLLPILRPQLFQLLVDRLLLICLPRHSLPLSKIPNPI